MLQEAFDLPSTQILSLYALGSYLATKPQLSVSKTAAEQCVRGLKNNVCFTDDPFSKWFMRDLLLKMLSRDFNLWLFLTDKHVSDAEWMKSLFSSIILDTHHVQVSEERAVGASLLICGLKQDNTVGLSAQLLGNVLLGVCFNIFPSQIFVPFSVYSH